MVAKFTALLHPSRKGDDAQRADARLGTDEYPAFVESLRGHELALCDDHDWDKRRGTVRNFRYDKTGIYGDIEIPIVDDASKQMVLNIVNKRTSGVSVGQLPPCKYKNDVVDVCADLSWVEVSICEEGQMEGARVITARSGRSSPT